MNDNYKRNLEKASSVIREFDDGREGYPHLKRSDLRDIIAFPYTQIKDGNEVPTNRPNEKARLELDRRNRFWKVVAYIVSTAVIIGGIVIKIWI
jgi:hypothetical protein